MVCSFEAHTNFIYDLAFNPDAEKYILYSCSEDGLVKAWDIVLNRNVSVLEKHAKGVRLIQLTNDGKSLISVGADNTIILWKLSNSQIIKVYSLDMIPAIESVYYFTRKIKNADSEKELNPTLLVGCEDGSLLELNLKKSQINDLSVRVNYLSQPIVQINYFPQAKRIIYLTADQCLVYLDIDIVNENIKSARVTKIMPGYCQEILDVKILSLDSLKHCEAKQSQEGLTSVHLSGERIDNSNNYNEDKTQGNEENNDEEEGNYKLDKNAICDSLEYIFSSNDNALKYFSKNKIQLFEGHTDFIMNIDIKNNFISTASKDNTIRLWKYYYGDSTFEEADELALKVEKGVNSSNKEFKCVCFAILKGHSEAVSSAALILKKAFQVASVSKDRSLKIWDFSSLISNENSETDFLNITEPYIIDESLFSEIPHDEEINMVRISPNEKLIATCSYDKTIKIFSRKLEELACLKGHKRAVSDISFSKYAKLLASASYDKTIKIWNLSDFTCLNTFEGHLSGVLKVSWIYYGTHLLSCILFLKIFITFF